MDIFCSSILRTCWVQGIEISMPRSQSSSSRASRSQWWYFTQHERVILRSSRRHTFAAVLCVQFGSQQGHHIRKQYSYCNHINSLLIYVVFRSEYSLFVQPVHLSFDKNTYHKLQTVSRRAIRLQAENAATSPVNLKQLHC